MKKLTGMEKGFSSLENKKLHDLKSIQGGGGATNDTWTDATCNNNTPDTQAYRDGEKVDGPVKTTHLSESIQP